MARLSRPTNNNADEWAMWFFEYAGHGAQYLGVQIAEAIDEIAALRTPPLRDLARAICKSRTCHGVDCCQWPANTGKRHLCPVDRGNYDEAAQAVITAFTTRQGGQS